VFSTILYCKCANREITPKKLLALLKIPLVVLEILIGLPSSDNNYNNYWSKLFWRLSESIPISAHIGSPSNLSAQHNSSGATSTGVCRTSSAINAK
jgi:hypothetical protein